MLGCGQQVECFRLFCVGCLVGEVGTLRFVEICFVL